MQSEEWLKQRKQIFRNLADQTLSQSDFTLSDDSIINELSEQNRLGSGAVGDVYAVGDVVVKRVSPCISDPEKPLYQYCSALLEDRFYLIPGGRGKFRYILPNLLTEIVIGMLLGSRFPDSYAKTLAGLITQDDSGVTVYIIMERLEPINPKSYTGKELVLLVHQVATALLEAQESYRFTHYDLHIENVLTQPAVNSVSVNIPSSSNVLITRPKLLAKISDFALARLETRDVIVSPEIDKFPVKSYGEFSPGYDILCLLGSLLVDTKYTAAWETVYKSDPDVYRFLTQLLVWIIGDPDIDTTNPRQAVQQIAERYYTPLKNNRFTFRPVSDQLFVNYTHTKTMAEIVQWMSQILFKKGWGTLRQGYRRIDYPIMSKIEKFIPNLEFTELPSPGQSLYRYQEMPIGEGVSARAYHIRTNFPANIYNFTLSERQVEECPIQEHYLNTIYISQSALKTFKWGLDCCKLDVVNYMAQGKRRGLTVNGGFFNINKEFLPIGVYEDEFVYVDEYDVPEEYRDVFAQVVLQNNQLKIEKYRKNALGETFTTGPILIRDREIVFNPNQLRYICTDEKNSQGIMISQDEKTITTQGYYKYVVGKDTCEKVFVPDVKTYRRCDRIGPGELSHADNPNPRSALCILDNGDYVLIAAEGRGRRGVGFDLYTLALTIKQNYPNVVSAVNLDGGRSSILAWRTTQKPDTVFVSNSDRDYIYPVGNILTLLDY